MTCASFNMGHRRIHGFFMFVGQIDTIEVFLLPTRCFIRGSLGFLVSHRSNFVRDEHPVDGESAICHLESMLALQVRLANFPPIYPQLSAFSPIFCPRVGNPEKAGVM